VVWVWGEFTLPTSNLYPPMKFLVFVFDETKKIFLIYFFKMIPKYSLRMHSVGWASMSHTRARTSPTPGSLCPSKTWTSPNDVLRWGQRLKKIGNFWIIFWSTLFWYTKYIQKDDETTKKNCFKAMWDMSYGLWNCHPGPILPISCANVRKSIDDQICFFWEPLTVCASVPKIIRGKILGWPDTLFGGWNNVLTP